MKRLLLLFMFVFTLFLPASDASVITFSDKVIGNASQKISYLEDKDGKFSLTEVKKLPFQTCSSGEPSFGFTDSAYWFKLSVYPDTSALSEIWWMGITYPLLDDIKFYLLDAQGRLKVEKQSGDLYPFFERDIANRYFYFKLPFTSSEPYTIYLRIHTEGAMQVPIEFENSKTLSEDNQLRWLLSGLYYGIFIIIFFYNITMYFYTREHTYALYLLFMLSFIMWQLTLDGIGVQYFWTDNKWMVEHGPPFWPALTILSMLVFSRNFLQTSKFLPQMDKPIIGLTAVAFVLTLISSLMPYKIAMLAPMILVIVVVPVLFISSVFVLRKNYRAARFYVVGWSAFLIGSLTFVLAKFDIFSGFYFFNYIQQIGSALEMMFLSLALADRVKLLEEEYLEKMKSMNVVLKEKVDDGIEQIRRQDQVLQRQSRFAALGEMIEQIAHQWRQPLNTLALLNNDLYFKIKMGISVEPFLDKMHNQVNDNLQYMSKTIDDFRNYYTAEKELERYAVEEVIENTVALNDALLKYAKVVCKVHYDKKHYVKTAKSEMTQVLMTLLKNSHDVLIDKKIEHAKIDIFVSADDAGVKVYVEDNGGGIKEEVIGKVFDSYFTTKSDGEGTGIGLYMAKTIVEKSMDGKLEVENSDTGARFIIRLPESKEN